MILALDISSSIIGYTILDLDAKLIEMKYIDLRKIKYDDDNIQLFEKAKFAICELRILLDRYTITHILIEAPLNQVFGTTILTAILLNKINSIISFELYKLGYPLQWINSETVRKKFLGEEYKNFKKISTKGNADAKKEYLTALVETKLNAHFETRPQRIDKYQPHYYDMADSYILGNYYFN